MQLLKYDTPQIFLATQECFTHTPRLPMQMEPESREESIILELENQIDKARREGEPIELLIEKRKCAYDSWIARLNRELGETRAEADQERLKQQLERALRHYGTSFTPPSALRMM